MVERIQSDTGNLTLNALHYKRPAYHSHQCAVQLQPLAAILGPSL
jgi:hypothetical protein